MKLKSTLKQYTMVIALVIVFIFFTVLTGGRLILAQNISNLLLQNAYVMVMACGMLLCILTGGNVDLSVGATLCLSAGSNSIAVRQITGCCDHNGNGCCTGYRTVSGYFNWIYPCSSVYLYTGRYVLIQRSGTCGTGFQNMWYYK